MDRGKKGDPLTRRRDTNGLLLNSAWKAVQLIIFSEPEQPDRESDGGKPILHGLPGLLCQSLGPLSLGTADPFQPRGELIGALPALGHRSSARLEDSGVDPVGTLLKRTKHLGLHGAWRLAALVISILLRWAEVMRIPRYYGHRAGELEWGLGGKTW